MLNGEIDRILKESRPTGWVLEPAAKKILALADIPVPKGALVSSPAEARQTADNLGFPLAAKVVSPEILHKSEHGGVRVGLNDEEALLATLEAFSKLEGFSGMLVEQMVPGMELIVGAKVDPQFGPVILLGIGGTGVEIYQDTALRMAPLVADDVASMVNCLGAKELLFGYRGAEPVNMAKLGELLLAFSDLVMAMGEQIESIDLNPVMASSRDCVVADARIILRR